MLRFFIEYKRKIDKRAKTHTKKNGDILKDINTTLM